MEMNGIVLLDGGMGTMLQAAGLPLGELPELWNITIRRRWPPSIGSMSGPAAG